MKLPNDVKHFRDSAIGMATLSVAISFAHQTACWAAPGQPLLPKPFSFLEAITWGGAVGASQSLFEIAFKNVFGRKPELEGQLRHFALATGCGTVASNYLLGTRQTIYSSNATVATFFTLVATSRLVKVALEMVKNNLPPLLFQKV